MTKTMTTMRTGTTSNPDPANGKKHALLWLVIPLSAVALAAAVNFLLIVNAVVPSASMEPTVPEGALVVGSRLAYLNRSPKAGDIIIFTHKEFPGKLLIKRVAATEGQRFAVTDERYISTESPWETLPEMIFRRLSFLPGCLSCSETIGRTQRTRGTGTTPSSAYPMSGRERNSCIIRVLRR